MSVHAWADKILNIWTSVQNADPGWGKNAQIDACYRLIGFLSKEERRVFDNHMLHQHPAEYKKSLFAYIDDKLKIETIVNHIKECLLEKYGNPKSYLAYNQARNADNTTLVTKKEYNSCLVNQKQYKKRTESLSDEVKRLKAELDRLRRQRKPNNKDNANPPKTEMEQP